MKNSSIRLRADQAAYIHQIIKERNTDLSDFIRLCVDFCAPVVAQSIPRRMQLGKTLHVPGIVSLRKLQAERNHKRRAA